MAQSHDPAARPRDAAQPRPTVSWWGAVVRAPVGPAQVRGLALRQDFDWSDVVVLTAADVPGENLLPSPGGAQPILAEDRVELAGEALALVAASSRARAVEAAHQLRLELVPLPPAPLATEPVHRAQLTRGDAAAVRVGLLVEGEFLVGPPAHPARGEARAKVWAPSGGPVRAIAAPQEAELARAGLRAALGAEEVQMEAGPPAAVPDPLRAGLEAAWAGLLSRRCGVPVRLAQEPPGPADPPAGWSLRARFATRVEDSGRLLSLSARLELDAGVWPGLSPQALQHAVEHTLGPYRCPHVRVEGVALASGRPPPSAAPEAAVAAVQFGLERQLDRIAQVLSLDPAEVRRVNALRSGDPLPSSLQRLGSDRVGEVLARALEAAEAIPAPPLRDAPGAGGGAARRLAGRGVALGLCVPDGGAGPAPLVAVAVVDLAVDVDTGELLLRRVLLGLSDRATASPEEPALVASVVRALRWALGPNTLAGGPERLGAADCPEIQLLPPLRVDALPPGLADPAVAAAVAAALAQAVEAATGATGSTLPLPSGLGVEPGP